MSESNAIQYSLGYQDGYKEGKKLADKPKGEWVDSNYTEYLNGGGSLLIKGWRCTKCGFFRRKKYGLSKFCEDCGADMRGGEDGSDFVL